MTAGRRPLALGLQGWLVAAFLAVGALASLTILVVLLPTLESSVREDRAKLESGRLRVELGTALDSALDSGALADPVSRHSLERLANELRLATGASIRLTFRAGGQLGGSETTVQSPANEDARTLLDEASRVVGDHSADGRLLAPILRRADSTTGTELLVRAARPLPGISPEIAIVRQRVIVAMVLVLTLAGLLGVLLARLLGGRLRALAHTAATVAGGDLGARSPELGLVPTELEVLGRSLDGMADRLQALVGAITDERDRDRAMIGSLAEGVLTVAADGTVLMANDAANRMLDLDGGGLVRLSSLPVGLQEAVLAVRAGRPTDQRTVSTADGMELELQVVQMAVRDGAASVITLRDVTDERRVERVRRDLVANVSHELKTPIAALKGFLELLEDDRVSVADRQAFLVAMSQETARLERLVEEQLQLARLDAGALPLDLRDVALGDLVSAVVEARVPLAERQELTLTVSARAGSGPTVLADDARIEQVVLILLDNAMRHTPAGGRVNVVVERGDREALLRVRDTGEGIPAADLPHVFDRFYRGDPSREGRSAGLGLAIARGLVAAHRGQILVNSTVGIGTVFTVSLPLISAGAVTVEAPIPRALRAEGVTAAEPPPPPPPPPPASPSGSVD